MTVPIDVTLVAAAGLVVGRILGWRVGWSRARAQAAMDGMGVALGREPMIDADMKAGRLVAPLNISLRSDAGYYVVMAPESAERPAVQAFRDWVMTLAGPNRRLDALAAGD